MTLTSRFSGFSLPVLLWILSFLCSLFFINDMRNELFMLSTLFLYGWSFLMLSRQMESGWRLPRSPTLIFAGLFWLLALASVFWADVKPAAVLGFCIFSAMPLTFFVGVACGDDGYFKKAALCLAVVFVPLSLWAMFQLFFLNAYFFGQARHPLADPSSLGALFSLALFCSLGWLLADRPKGEHRKAVILSILLVCGIISTVSRGPVFAFIPGIVLLIWLLRPQARAKWKSLAIVAMGAAAYYALTLTGLKKIYDLGARLLGTMEMRGDITNNRLAVWEAALHMIKDKPWLGTGIGTFYLNYPAYRLPTEVNGVFLAHSDPLQFWTELGILGPVLFYAFCIAAAVRTFAALKNLKGEENRNARVLVASLFCGFAAMIVQSHVSFNLYNLCILMVAGLMLSIWFVFTGRALKEIPKIVSVRNESPMLNRILLVLPFAMMAWLAFGITAGEIYVNRARDNLFNGQMMCINFAAREGENPKTNDCFMQNLIMASRVSHDLNYRAYLFAVNVPMSILELKSSGKAGTLTDEEADKLYRQVVDYMNLALDINPHLADAYFYLGKVQTMVPVKIIPQGTPSPEEYYKKALAQDPSYLSARLALYTLYKASLRSNSELLALLEPGINFYYNTPLAMDYYGALGRTYAEMGNYGKMRESAQLDYKFRKRSAFSKARQETSIPQAIMGRDALLPKYR